MVKENEDKSVYIQHGYQPKQSIEKGYQPSGTAAGESTQGPSNPPTSGSAEQKNE